MTGINSENQIQKITVYVDSDLLPLIPEFLENRQKDLIALKKALEQSDYPVIQAIGYNLKGSGGSYGLDKITEIGKLLEQAAENKSVTEIRELVSRLSSYLENLEVLETKRNAACAFCGRPFQPRSDEKYCPQCIVDKQEKIIEKSEEKAPVKKKRDKRVLWIAFMLLFAAACVVVLFIQVPKILDGARPGKPIRQGTYETDKATDECIKNLWVISKELQENKTPNSSIRCPATNEPYKFETAKAYCPNPDKHNLKSLSVSKETKIPEALK